MHAQLVHRTAVVFARPPPRCGTLSNKSAKQSREMRLICEPAFGRNLSEGFIGRQHQSLRPLYSAPDDVVVRRVTYACAEYSVEVKHTQARHCSEIAVPDPVLQICIAVKQNTPDQRWREGPARPDGGRGYPFSLYGFKHDLANCRDSAALMRNSAAFVRGCGDLPATHVDCRAARSVAHFEPQVSSIPDRVTASALAITEASKHCQPSVSKERNRCDNEQKCPVAECSHRSRMGVFRAACCERQQKDWAQKHREGSISGRSGVPEGQAAFSCMKSRRAFSAIAAIAGCLILRSREIA